MSREGQGDIHSAFRNPHSAFESSPKNQPQGVRVGEKGVGGKKTDPESEAAHLLAGNLSPENGFTVLLGKVFQG